MKTEKILLTTTIIALVALARFRCVSFLGGIPTAGAPVLGVATTNADAGEPAGVNTHGDILVEAAAAIAVGAEVESDATGRVVTKTTGAAFGRARDAAAAAGDIIRVLK